MTLLSSFGFSSKSAEEIKEDIQKTEKESTFEPLLKNEFKVTPNGDGAGTVVARILPAMESFKVNNPHVMVRKHFISYKGLVYDSLCPGFFSDDCPICSFIREKKLWDKSSPYNKYNYGEWANNKPVVPRLSATEDVFVNVYIKSDVNDASNNHKVFQYKLPKAIFKTYEGYLKGNPEIGQEPDSVFDIMNGRDLQISFYKDKNKQGLRQYDTSKFNDKGPIKSLDGRQIDTSPESFIPLFESMQDLHTLIDPETRAYSVEEAQAKFAELLQVIEEEMNGGEGGNFSSKDMNDGFDNVDLKSDNTTVSKKEMDDLTSGKFDSSTVVDNDQALDDMMNEVDDLSFDDLDELIDMDLN